MIVADELAGSVVPSEGPSEQSLANLFRTVARHCRGSTGIVGTADVRLVRAIRKRGGSAVGIGSSRSHPDASFRTVLVYQGLERVRKSDGTAFIETAWQLVEPGGELFVIVPNEGFGDDPLARQAFVRKSLRRRLKVACRASPLEFRAQPYRWLLMGVRKPPADGRARPDKEARYEVTAALCRGRTIELGCSTGRLSRLVHDRGLEAVGVDLRPEAVDIARRMNPGPTFLEGDITTLDLPRESFDTAVIAEVLEHVDDEVGDLMLDKAWGLVRPGGRLIVSVPNEDCIPHRNHVRTWTRESLRSMLERFGKPELIGDQPFKWLLMVVPKPGA